MISLTPLDSFPSMIFSPAPSSSRTPWWREPPFSLPEFVTLALSLRNKHFPMEQTRQPVEDHDPPFFFNACSLLSLLSSIFYLPFPPSLAPFWYLCALFAFCDSYCHDSFATISLNPFRGTQSPCASVENSTSSFPFFLRLPLTTPYFPLLVGS